MRAGEFVCYYFGLSISWNYFIHRAREESNEACVRDGSWDAFGTYLVGALTLFDSTCSNWRLCEAKRISVF